MTKYNLKMLRGIEMFLETSWVSPMAKNFWLKVLIRDLLYRAGIKYDEE